MEEIAWKMGRKYVSENTGGGHPTEPRVPTGCPYKERCSRAKGNKRLYISKSFLEKRQESYENILSEKGILYRMNRSIRCWDPFNYYWGCRNLLFVRQPLFSFSLPVTVFFQKRYGFWHYFPYFRGWSEIPAR